MLHTGVSGALCWSAQRRTFFRWLVGLLRLRWHGDPLNPSVRAEEESRDVSARPQVGKIRAAIQPGTW